MTQQQELDAQTLDEAKSQKISEIKANYITEKYADIDFNNTTFDFTSGQSNRLDLMSLISGDATNISWIDKSKKVSITTMEKLKELSLALNNRTNILFAEKQTKIALVNSATQKSEVREI